MAEQRGGNGADRHGERPYLSIGEVLSHLQEEFPDVTISKIRFLESQGLIDPERTPSGYRKFYDLDVERLRFILHEQREHFLPLKVIKDRLDSGETLDDNGAGPGLGSEEDAGAEATPAGAPNADRPEAARDVTPRPGGVSEAGVDPAERLPIWMVRTPPGVERDRDRSNARSDETFSFEEVAANAGLTVEELREVERFGLVIGRVVGGTTLYDAHAVAAARTAGGFLQYGVEPRHLRLYRNAADREAGLIEQVIMPWVKQRNPQSRAHAQTTLEALARLGGELREAMLRQTLRPYSDG
jgi:DNA-binding transcriptional MerR regulator